MSLTLRQICLVAEDLQKTLADFKAIFGIDVCYQDPAVEKFGLVNSLLAIGTNFFEIVSPTKDNTAAGRYIQRRGGNGGYMVITQADNVEVQQACRSRAEEMGVRIAWERTHETGTYMQLHPVDTGGSFFEIDTDNSDDPEGNWHPAGGIDWKQSVNSDIVTGILAAELQSAQPSNLAQKWSDIAGIPLENNDMGNPIIPLNNASLRFVKESDGRGEGLGAVDVVVANPNTLLSSAEERGLRISDHQVIVGGLRFNLVYQ